LSSSLCDRPINELNLVESFDMEIIAVSRRNITQTERLSDISLKPGDVILIKSSLEITQDKLVINQIH
jgi:hypothetical protein